MSGVLPAGLPTSAPAPEPRATRPADRSTFEHALEAAGREPTGDEPVEAGTEGDESDQRPAEASPEALLAALVAFAPPPPPVAAPTAALGASAAAPVASATIEVAPGGPRSDLAGAGDPGAALRINLADPTASAQVTFGPAGAALASVDPVQAALRAASRVQRADSAAGQASGAAAAALASASLGEAVAPAAGALVKVPSGVATAAAGEPGVVSSVAAKGGERGQTALAGRQQASSGVRVRQARTPAAEAASAQATSQGDAGAKVGADATLPRFSFDRVSLSAERAQGDLAKAAGKPEVGVEAGGATRAAKPNAATGAASGAEGREGASADLAKADAGQALVAGAEHAAPEAPGLGAAPGEAAPAPGVVALGVATPSAVPVQVAARAATELRASTGAEAAGGDDERQRLVAAGVNRLTLRREGLRAEADVPELGRVSVEARSTADGAIDVRVAAADPVAAMALGRHQGEIVRALEAASVPIGRVSVEAQGQGAQHAFRDGGGSARDGARGGRDRDSSDDQPAPRPGRRRVRIVL
jgi:hypothetical protein